MRRRSRIILGLNSGTSADGIDAVACEISGRGTAMQIRYLGHVSRRYPAKLRQRLLDAMAPARTTTEEICRLNAAVGEAFAAAAEKAIDALALSRVDAIGSHGQTICHLPPGRGASGGKSAGGGESGTLQIGAPAIIAERIGVPVIADFRQADIAAGGQGAPLVPWTDYILFRDPLRGRIMQNIGGIANLTWIPPGAKQEDVVAFDTGPGNMLIDGLCTHFSDGGRRYDRGGAWAAKGRVREALLHAMRKHPFLKRQPPKSCGREEFGDSYMRELLARFTDRDWSEFDWVATATRFTAECIVRAYEHVITTRAGHAGAPPWLDEVILCGGGERNRMLVAVLITLLDGSDALAGARDPLGVPVTSTDDYGIPIQAKEALSFAMLAAARLDGIPANLPQVTGARRRVLLGNVSEPTPASVNGR